MTCWTHSCFAQRLGPSLRCDEDQMKAGSLRTEGGRHISIVDLIYLMFFIYFQAFSICFGGSITVDLLFAWLLVAGRCLRFTDVLRWPSNGDLRGVLARRDAVPTVHQRLGGHLDFKGALAPQPIDPRAPPKALEAGPVGRPLEASPRSWGRTRRRAPWAMACRRRRCGRRSSWCATVRRCTTSRSRPPSASAPTELGQST